MKKNDPKKPRLSIVPDIKEMTEEEEQTFNDVNEEFKAFKDMIKEFIPKNGERLVCLRTLDEAHEWARKSIMKCKTWKVIEET